MELPISDEILKEAKEILKNDETYYNEFLLLNDCLNKYPKNTVREIVALKCGIIDITNSTHLSQHKSDISICELVNKILEVNDIDSRIKKGDPTVVDEIARNGNINLLSFASKFCTYHNICVYDKDEYSIYDTVVANIVPKIFQDEMYKSMVDKYKEERKKKGWQAKVDGNTVFSSSNYKNEKFNYEDYRYAIDLILEANGITINDKRRAFDNLVWYKFRNQEA